MTLFRKVFNQNDDTHGSTPIRNSYDLAMAPEPEAVADMQTLAAMFDDTPELQELEEPARYDEPSSEAVAEAQSMIAAAEKQPQPSERTISNGRRNKTRLLGFNPSADEELDPLNGASANAKNRTHPVGWLVIIDGAGTGQSFSLYDGVASIGRGKDQVICLDFGDTSVSRENHAAIAYDPEQSRFFLGHGGKSNIIRLNDKPVLSTENITHGDTIRIGETTLRLAGFCDDSFHWGTKFA